VYGGNCEVTWSRCCLSCQAKIDRGCSQETQKAMGTATHVQDGTGRGESRNSGGSLMRHA
jgi:hypothetical protein